VAGTFGLLTGSVPVDLQADLVGAFLPSADQPVSGKAPLELLAGAIIWPIRVEPLRRGRPGLTNGLGTPDLRLVFGLRFARRVPGRDRYADRDGDRVPDYRDDCLNDQEDRDGFEDDDGCPEEDNDHDASSTSATSARPRPRSPAAM